MFFTENSTSLASNIPAAVGYSDGCGAVRALIEAEQNRHNIVEAMMKMDFQEIQMRKSANFNEAAITTLHEGALGDIWAKIVAVLKSIVAKLKAIFDSFIAKISSLWAKDKDYVKKYKKVVMYEPSRYDKMPVKWRKTKSGTNWDYKFELTATSLDDLDNSWKEDSDDRKKQLIANGWIGGHKDLDPDNIHDGIFDIIFADDSESEYDFSEIGISVSALIAALEGFNKKIKDFDSQNRKNENQLKKLVKQAEDRQSAAAKEAIAAKGQDQAKENENVKASHILTCAQDVQSMLTTTYAAVRDALIIDYKQHKAAFVKMAAAGKTKKYEFANVLAEMAEDEVDEVIASAIDGKDAKELDCMYNKAPYDVLPPGTSNDPDELVYEPDSYTDTPCDTVSGSTGVDYVAKNEAFNFKLY